MCAIPETWAPPTVHVRSQRPSSIAVAVSEGTSIHCTSSRPRAASADVSQELSRSGTGLEPSNALSAASWRMRLQRSVSTTSSLANSASASWLSRGAKASPSRACAGTAGGSGAPSTEADDRLVDVRAAGALRASAAGRSDPWSAFAMMLPSTMVLPLPTMSLPLLFTWTAPTDDRLSRRAC
jgi:hypothetical protein